METLDVTKIPGGQKHPTIFGKFDALSPGESFVIINDHDPKPLYYQFVGIRGDTFEWKYLQEGPDIWKVQIGKTEKGQNQKTVAELAAEDYRKAEVFKEFGIDFCCGGNQTVHEACEKEGVDQDELREAMNRKTATQTHTEHYNDWSLRFLMEYIINNHHQYTRETLPELNQYAKKVKNEHGQQLEGLEELHKLIQSMEIDLMQHMNKEEQLLFPSIEELEQKAQTGEPTSFDVTIQTPIEQMEHEHKDSGDMMEKVQSLTNDFQPPENACNTHRLFYQKLQEFDADLKKHIHLENNILFPKALQLEQQMYEGRQPTSTP